jgi:hypothetical protein
MRLSAVLLTALLFVLDAETARADAVGPPPADCPEGSRGEVCHGAEYCGIASCIGPRDCAVGERCAARELCLGTRMCFDRGGGATSVTDVVAGTCSGCAGRCESQFVCVGDAIDAGRRDAGGFDAGTTSAMDAGADDDSMHSRYCGCSVPSRANAIPSGAIALLASLLLTIGRRRAARGASAT